MGKIAEKQNEGMPKSQFWAPVTISSNAAGEPANRRRRKRMRATTDTSVQISVTKNSQQKHFKHFNLCDK